MSIPSWVRAGHRVICIKADKWQTPDRGTPTRQTHPRISEECTISRVVTDHTGTWLQLHGYNSRDIYHWSRFKPAVEDKSDDEIEARLYHEKRQHHKAPARKVVSA